MKNRKSRGADEAVLCFFLFYCIVVAITGPELPGEEEFPEPQAPKTVCMVVPSVRLL